MKRDMLGKLPLNTPCNVCGVDTIATKRKHGRVVPQSRMCRTCLNCHQKYGLNRVTRQAMLDAQGGCLLCSSPVRFGQVASGRCRDNIAVVDHCHVTGVVRGILCCRCNITLGKVRDDPALLRSMAEYVEKFK